MYKNRRSRKGPKARHDYKSAIFGIQFCHQKGGEKVMRTKALMISKKRKREALVFYPSV